MFWAKTGRTNTMCGIVIREYFQGRNDKGIMNSKSDNETYNELIGNLRSMLKILIKKIEPKVYEYGFLKE